MFTILGPRLTQVNAYCFGAQECYTCRSRLGVTAYSDIVIIKNLPTSDTNRPDHDELDRALEHAGIAAGAAEVHGTLTGLLCTPNGAQVDWRALISNPPGDELPPDLALKLTLLFQHTQISLQSVNYEFEPLLPGDDHSLSQQTESLADWCRGYVLGMIAGGIKEVTSLPGDAGEIVNDIIRISQADVADAEDDEQAERALVELTEYIRVGVQLVFEEFQPPALKH